MSMLHTTSTLGPNIAINPALNIQLVHVGISQTPILVIDDYLQSTAELIHYARFHGKFSPDNTSYYPGVRSKLPKEYVVACLKPLMKRLYSVFAIPTQLRPNPIDNTFSLVTVESENLLPVQTLPHFDTCDPNLLAVVHYLNPLSHGGTGFFRHNRSAIERVNLGCEQEYLMDVQRLLNKSPHSQSQYCATSHPAYTCIYQVPYQQNRLLIYPGNLLHSALINKTGDINTDPNTGRLTANMFIKFS